MCPAEFPASPEAQTSDLDVPPHSSRPLRRERLLARGLIGVLLVVMVIELVAHVRMTIMNQRLWSELQKGERERADVTRERIDAVAKRLPDESFTVHKPVGEEKYDGYRFWGLLKRRELYVHYGVQGIRSPQEAIAILTDLPDGVRKSP